VSWRRHYFGSLAAMLLTAGAGLWFEHLGYEVSTTPAMLLWVACMVSLAGWFWSFTFKR